ncbi:hypothetical protein [Feifania hominis]|uniref:Uncharacterized protein n=1 Tax=Feifania hominis TaxID=2763660 RepID=A0A926DFP0_9FIRM|nr:hypothetical protein [Feifania hominis]MBC8537298.1 hypothetical protein [Feifania hominis]
MTKEQIELLTKYKNGKDFSEWCTPSGSVMRYLLEAGLIESDCTVSPNFFRASQKGLSELSRLEEVTNENSRKKREKKLDRIFQIFLLILGFILGVAAEHFGTIVESFLSLFR